MAFCFSNAGPPLAQLEAIEKGSFSAFLSLIRQGHDHLHVTLAAIAHRNFYSPFEFFSPVNAWLLLRLNVTSFWPSPAQTLSTLPPPWKLKLPTATGWNHRHGSKVRSAVCISKLTDAYPQVLRKHYSYIKGFFTDPRLRAAFTFQDMYIGVSPFDAPATFSLLQVRETQSKPRVCV